GVKCAASSWASWVGTGSAMPAPGSNQVASTNPSASDTHEAAKNQSKDLSPILPTSAIPSMREIPAVRVAKISGAMIMRISRTNAVVTNASASATRVASASSKNVWQYHPAAMPKTIDTSSTSVKVRSVATMPLDRFEDAWLTRRSGRGHLLRGWRIATLY